MLIKKCFFKALILLNLFTLIANQVNGLDSRKLDESTGGGGDVKCNPTCVPTPSPPPPPPPSPCPPPPALPPPPPSKPPTPKKPPTQFCPPPPSIIYITGPPGNLYPIDGYFSGANRKMVSSSSPILVGFVGLLGLLAFF